jgi:hypothetical protein
MKKIKIALRNIIEYSIMFLQKLREKYIYLFGVFPEKVRRKKKKKEENNFQKKYTFFGIIPKINFI